MREELLSQLAKQRKFLERSSAAWDAGDRDEYPRIAVSLRILFHRTKNQTPLLDELSYGQKKVVSSVHLIPMTVVSGFGMGTYRIGPSGAAYLPTLDIVASEMCPKQWFQQIVHVLGPELKLARKDIILNAANKDGGAHVDLRFTSEYLALSQPGAVGNFLVTPPGATTALGVPIEDAHSVAIRQMAHEVLSSTELWSECRKYL